MARVKPCVNCGQEIPADAAVCRLCGRSQPAPRIAPKSQGISYSQAGRLTVLAAFATVAMMVWAQKFRPGTFEAHPKPALQVSGSRQPDGLEITNRESETLTKCIVRIPEQWTVMVDKLAPQETRSLTWAQFRNAAGTEMPVRIAQTARYATVGCDSHKETRKGGAVSLR